MKFRLSPTAAHDLDEIYDYIAQDNVRAAAEVISRIIDAIARLEDHPRLGREGRRARTRELIHPPYVIVYRIRADVIAVDAILHSSRRFKL